MSRQLLQDERLSVCDANSASMLCTGTRNLVELISHGNQRSNLSSFARLEPCHCDGTDVCIIIVDETHNQVLPVDRSSVQ